MSTSPLLELAKQPPAVRRAWLDGLTDAEVVERYYSWALRARPEQLAPPGDWTYWLIMAGRGFGKTRAGAEWVRSNVTRYGRWLLVGRTSADVRDVMIEGESGLLNIGRPDERPLYEPSKRRLTWPNGAVGILRESAEPEALRGEQAAACWCDELASWIYPQETWDNLLFGFRLGDKPRMVITTTPKPIPLVRQLLTDPAAAVTRGSTYDNQANLPRSFFDAVIQRYEGTRLGRQELNAELLDDVPGALWTRAVIDAARVRQHPDLVRVVVGVDPAATSNEDSDATGIVVAALGDDGHGYVLDDGSAESASPAQWGAAAVQTYQAHHADRIVAEANQGGEMVEHVIRSVDGGRMVSYKSVHASRGKQTRAEPIAALYERGMIHHVGSFPTLEDEMCGWVPGMASPDRMDALVWALHELFPADGTLPYAGWED